MNITPDTLSRAQGCLVGQLAGDALGSLVEFQFPSEIRRHFPHGVRQLVDGGMFLACGHSAYGGRLSFRWAAVKQGQSDSGEVTRIRLSYKALIEVSS